MTIKSKIFTQLLSTGLLLSLLMSLLVLPSYAKKHEPPPAPLQLALQKFLQSYKGRLLRVEYEHEKNIPYYRVAYLDAKGVVQHLRVWDKGQENLHQEVKFYPQPPVNLLSLQQILKKTFGGQKVRLLQAILKPHKEGYEYKLEWVDAQGIAWEGKYEARTGRQISRKRD
jgi:hypothetical protein